MAFKKAVKGTILAGGGALATVLGLSQFAHYRRKQMTLAYVEAAECISEPVNREPPSREAQLLTLQNTSEFDVLVIGGGATGCGCALDAVTRVKYRLRFRRLPCMFIIDRANLYFSPSHC